MLDAIGLFSVLALFVVLGCSGVAQRPASELLGTWGLNVRAHPADWSPTWMGHSIGTWDGDTLVIDSVGFNDKTWFHNDMPHTERLHVIERYRRLDLGRLEVEVTYDDPGTLTKPWSSRFIWELVPGEEIQEYVCENNRYQQLVGGQK